jgi:RecG-like helicase
MPVARRIAGAVGRGRIVVTGAVTCTETTSHGGSPAYRCEIDDGTGVIAVLFLGRPAVAGLVEGARCTIEGTVQQDKDGLVVWNPRYRLETPYGS